jgi:hypothetical protein
MVMGLYGIRYPDVALRPAHGWLVDTVRPLPSRCVARFPPRIPATSKEAAFFGVNENHLTIVTIGA